MYWFRNDKGVVVTEEFYPEDGESIESPVDLKVTKEWSWLRTILAVSIILLALFLANHPKPSLFVREQLVEAYDFFSQLSHEYFVK